jgi:hypothetical protein
MGTTRANPAGAPTRGTQIFFRVGRETGFRFGAERETGFTFGVSAAT